MASQVRIKDHHAEQRLFTRRAIAASVIMFLAVGSMIARLVWLQVVQYDYFFDQSQGNRIRIEPIPPNRGLILDRSGTPLALNAPSYQLELTREQVPNLDAALQGLAALQLLDREDLPALKKEIMGRRSFEGVPVKLQLTDEELARFAVRRQDFPGVEIKPRLTRYYPLGTSAVHALGYVSAISEGDEKNLNMDEYAGTTLVGKSGVERKYEPELHGKTGFQQLLVNAQGRRVDHVGLRANDLKRRPAVAGNDLYLSIDERVQSAAEEMLRGKRAAAVAIDPFSGDIIAFVSTPGFDPNLFGRGLTRQQYAALTQDIDKPIYDRVLRGVYPPGSTVKPLMALTALEYNVIQPDERRFCRGFFTLPGSSHRYRDWRKQGHGFVDMRRAIEQSCDTYFYAVAEMIGIDRMHTFLDQFSLGREVGIDIGGEKPGLLPSTAWKQKAFKRPELKTWFPGETVIAGIGQGFMLATPLQLAHATATIAAKGKRYAPRLVHAIRDSVTGEIKELPPIELPAVKVRDPAAWDIVTAGMVDVTTRGTAKASAAGAKYSIAGKTGTAQVFTLGQNEKYNEKEVNERLLDHALYVAFAPADAPKLAVAILIENGKHGASAAAPVARKIFDAYLLTPEEQKAQQPKVNPAQSDAGDE